MWDRILIIGAGIQLKFYLIILQMLVVVVVVVDVVDIAFPPVQELPNYLSTNTFKGTD